MVAVTTVDLDSVAVTRTILGGRGSEDETGHGGMGWGTVRRE